MEVEAQMKLLWAHDCELLDFIWLVSVFMCEHVL